ncbi:3-ketoacyl-CoA thiolase/acetyl-CoA acetyltransferase [Cenarchaeum symbiosum A]|uniref:3-ketoacyl-CoA thiolase/acetyl-CoA acetyltransferase n=1 Tax=Cenarchaeum symbiosum (strain A) TaxID=414004 RepID=A0RV53_CENSY|nr:3-ketoacyl-CoA thiolase/acetyl-CoA acetyltransferase [Cenarchaeum symbiosum A]
MRPVFAVGTGGTKFGLQDVPVEESLLEASAELFLGTDIQRESVDAVIASTNDNSKYLGAILAEKCGITPRIAHTVESLCSSGTSAIVSGVSYIASGMAEVVLVAGAEKSKSPGGILEWDQSRGGYPEPVFWASLFAGAYKREHGASAEDLAAVAAKNHRNAASNPRACSAMDITIQDVLESRSITDDLKLYECSRECSGGAAILLASKDAARGQEAPVRISGIGQRTVSASLSGAGPLVHMESTAMAAADALAASNRSAKEIDVMELHDAFGICEPMALEGIGIAGKGRGAAFCSKLYETGDNFVNPRGGLIGAGHPLGATGIAQANEIVMQLQGAAKGRQVEGAAAGLVHNMSAAATSSTVLVMEA